MAPEEFIAWLAPAAQAQCAKRGLPASCLIAQGAIESLWGEAKIGDFNLFGRKWGGWGQYSELPTWEVYDGREVRIIAKFQLYDTLEQACADWCDLMEWNGPESENPVRTYKYWSDQYKSDHNLENFIRGMAGIYATDPEYFDKIIMTIRASDLTQYDV